MKDRISKLLKIDRRWLFLLLTFSILIPIIKPLGILSKSVSPSVENVYKFIEGLPEGAAIILSLDYDPSTAPELHPQAAAVMKHAFKKNLKVIITTFLAGSGGLIEELVTTIPPRYGKEYGKDFVVLPYMPNVLAALTQMASDIEAFYPNDKDGRRLKDLEMMRNIKNYRDISAIIGITGTALLDSWMVYVGDKYGVPVMGGVTSISQVGYGPYLQKGQLKGLIGGMKGAAEYEKLISQPWKGTSGIDALNIAQLLVIFLIVMSNIVILIMKFL